MNKFLRVAATYLSLVTFASSALAGPMGPATGITVKAGAPRSNEREGTVDYPVVFTNTGSKPTEQPIQIVAPPGTKNVTTSDTARRYVTLPTALAPGQSFEQIFRIEAPKNGWSPDFTPLFESAGVYRPKDAPPPRIVTPAPGEYRAAGQPRPRIRAVAGEEYLWDVDATNPQGGTLKYTVAPIPAPLPADLASATALTGATIEPVTGVFRWTPPSAGLFTARIGVGDGKALTPSFYDLVFQVEANAGAALTCADYNAQTYTGVAVPVLYRTTRDGQNGPPSVIVAPNRTATCNLSPTARLADGTYPVSCETNDALFPAASCKFNVNIKGVPGTPPTSGSGTVADRIVLPFGTTPNLALEQADCGAGGDPAAQCEPGYAAFRIRNNGGATARGVTAKIPYPAEATREFALMSSDTKASCDRNRMDDNAPLICNFGDLAKGAVATIKLAFAPKNYVPYFSQTLISVTTTDTELTLHDNTLNLRPGSPIKQNELQGDFVKNIKVPCDAECRKRNCLAASGPKKSGEGYHTLALLSGWGRTCDKLPAWTSYIITGVIALGAIVAIGGVVILAPSNFLLNAGQAGGTAATALL